MKIGYYIEIKIVGNKRLDVPLLMCKNRVGTEILGIFEEKCIDW